MILQSSTVTAASANASLKDSFNITAKKIHSFFSRHKSVGILDELSKDILLEQVNVNSNAY